MGINLVEMLKHFIWIMIHDYRKGNGTFRILWKSVARWRRLGWDGMLEWLDKEMWKLPNNQKKLQIDTYAYQRWIEKKEPKSFTSERISSNIKFSVILFLDNNQSSFARLINSLIAQHYANWELIIVSDSLECKTWNDKRITRTKAKSANTKLEQLNFAMEEATGEWIVFADRNMMFSPHAFTEMAISIQQNPQLYLIYSDEDTIAEDAQRSNPHFKSDFNPDLLYSTSYVGKALSCKTNVFDAIGRFHVKAMGCWEYDLVLRIWEYGGDKTIYHIPKILFHFENNYDEIASRKKCEREVLKEHFDRIGQNVLIQEGLCPQTNYIYWFVTDSLPLVTIIIPTRDHVEILRKCIESIQQKTRYPMFEIIIVDNQSTRDETIHFLDELSDMAHIKVIKYDRTFNYSAINNYAVSHANGEVIVLMNNDVEVISSNWLDEMVSHACRDEIGCVGAMLYYPDDTIQHAGVIVGLGDVAGHAHKYMIRGSSGYFNRACVVQNYSAVTGACLAIRKRVYEKVGGLDEKNLTVAYNDIDLGLKVQRAGYRNLWTPYAELYHYESKSRGKDNTREKKERYRSEVDYMCEQWADIIKQDPYYHPLLTKTAEQFQLRRM